MSKKARFSLLFIMTVFFFSLGFLASGEINNQSPAEDALSSSPGSGNEPCEKEEYVVTLYEGELYLYRISGNDRYLLKKADSPTPREEDILPLTEGIRSDSLSAALSVFEDFIM